jgi:acetyl-CoA C-acetyltransferase
MGVCADLCATEYEFSREDQDNYAINRTNVQQKHGNWNLTKKLFLLLYQEKVINYYFKDEEFTNVKWIIPTLMLFY